MKRLLVLVAGLLVPTIAVAQEVPAQAEMDLWCGTAFEVMTKDAPADATPEKLAAADVYAQGAQRLIDRALPIYLESGYDDAQLAALRTQLEHDIGEAINEAPGEDGPKYSFQDCSALIGQ